MKLTIGISPCPNDTFIFDAIFNHRLKLGDLQFEFHMLDVEQLNRAALEGRFDVTKLSYFAFTQMSDNYQMLRSGGALGHNCGPLLVSHDPRVKLDEHSRIAIPGIHTTANFLLTKAYPFLIQKTETLFSDIESAVALKKFDAGLIIHESRFTYMNKGLHLIKDLGQYWKEQTQTPIPLGGIVIKRNLPEEVKKEVNRLIAESVTYAFKNPNESKSFVQQHAQEMEEVVVNAHIALYVNSLSVDLGEQGRKGVDLMFQQLPSIGITANITQPLFVEG